MLMPNKCRLFNDQNGETIKGKTLKRSKDWINALLYYLTRL